MKLYQMAAITFLAFTAVSSLTGCTRVPNGHVGVKFNSWGDDKGVENSVVGPGTYFPGPNTTIIQYPTFTQTDKWQRPTVDSKDPDESITFQAAGGINVGVDLGVSYHIEQADVVTVFKKYRKGVEEISDTILHNMVRDEMNRQGIKYDSESLQGAGKQKLLDDAFADAKQKAKANGITLDSISYISGLRFPDSVQNAINAKIQATQDAMRVENEVRKTKAEQEKVVVIAQAQVQVAQADAEATALRGAALHANPEIIRLKEIDMQNAAIAKWNGVLPITNAGGSLPFLNLPNVK